ncbi:hypothetical protein [Brevifollis gellanilyticus]|uniref:Uncharacterized protein n=1 Tax=Brevifollis gellanilyticus TaxID=748831 RepID=A0A512MI47_9BACT|nr:hypothetical protein [Brevifollis gellanilyticus]GEP46416.1 hypothetical protein BGE01nite_57070 [Brevifollis gellanilyticus]
MKQHLLQLTGRSIGLIAIFILIIGYALLPASCTLTPEQQQRLQAISVPVTSLLSTAAVQRGWIQPGDKILIQRGVAVVTSAEDSETKLYRLAEIGLEQAQRQGTVTEGDVIELKNASQATITHPADVQESVPSPSPATPLSIQDASHPDHANPSLLNPTK